MSSIKGGSFLVLKFSLSLFFLDAALFFPFQLNLIFLGSQICQSGLLLLFLVLGALLLYLGRDHIFEVRNSFFQPVNFSAKTEQFTVHFQGFFVLFLPLEGVAKGQIRVHVLLAVANAGLKVRDSLGVLTADVVQDACVVEHDRVHWVQVDRTLVVVKCLVELSSAFHVDTHVLEDTRLLRVVSDGILVLGESLRAIAKLLVDDAQVDLRLVVVGLETQYLAQIQIWLARQLQVLFIF